MVAILAHEGEFVRWPTQEERREISDRIHADSGFPDCIGFADGTLFPLATKPMLNGEDWFNKRKRQYAIATLVVCDHDKRIRYLYTGWPGSVHDQRIYTNTDIAQQSEAFFSPGQYLLADTGYAPTHTWFRPSSGRAGEC
jgi:DDE superfamily endonuclease